MSPKRLFQEISPIYSAREEGTAPELFGPVPRNDDEIVALARGRAPDSRKRRALIDSLTDSWAGMNLPSASLRSIEQLENPATHIVIAGQQPALAGGPLFLCAKALSVTRLARRLCDLAVPTVPLFWIADEDHNVSELESGAIPGAGVQSWLANPFPPGRVPVRDLRIPDVDAVISAARDTFTEEVVEKLGATADPSPGVWFRKLLLELIGDEGLVPVTPGQLFRDRAPIIARELRAPGALTNDVAKANEVLRGARLPVTIESVPELPFFCHEADGTRHRVEAEAGGWRSRGPAGETLGLEEAEQLLEAHPERLSPDALLRPLIQDALFEPLAVIAGPTEMAYQLQLAFAYGGRGIRRPLLMPRLRARLLDADVVAELDGSGIDPVSLEPQVTPAQVVPSARAVVLSQEVDSAGEELLRSLEKLEREGDHALAKRASRLRRRWQQDRERLLDAIDRGAAVDETESRRRAIVERALKQLYPGGEEGERTLSVLHYLSRYGVDVLRHVGEAYDPYDSRPRLLAAPPAKNQPSGVSHG